VEHAFFFCSTGKNDAVTEVDGFFSAILVQNVAGGNVSFQWHGRVVDDS